MEIEVQLEKARGDGEGSWGGTICVSPNYTSIITSVFCDANFQWPDLGEIGL